MQQIGTALQGSRPRGRKDRQPVRGGSHRRGRCEGTYWRRTNRQETRRVLLGAKVFDREQKPFGRPNGPIGHVGLQVLELFVNLIDHATGRLEPSVAFICKKIGRCRSAVIRALKALRAHGFIDWLRRYEETGCEGAGPQVRQVTNAYRLLLPAWAAQRLGVKGTKPPLPDDFAQEQDDRAAERVGYKAALPLDALALVEVEDTVLSRVLAAMGQHIQERESARGSEIQSKGLNPVSETI